MSTMSVGMSSRPSFPVCAEHQFSGREIDPVCPVCLIRDYNKLNTEILAQRVRVGHLQAILDAYDQGGGFALVEAIGKAKSST